MSVSIASAGGSGTFQPYQCLVCQSRFTRHENLKRHAALHSRPQGQALLSCELCDATFSRQDLRSRHMKRKHPEQIGRRMTRASRQDPATTAAAATATQVCGARKSRRGKASPSSPAESQNGSGKGDECESGMEDGIWQAALGLEQRHQLDHDQHDFMGDGIDLNNGSGTTGAGDSHSITALLSDDQSMSDLMSIENMVQDVATATTTSNHQSLLLGQSLPSPAFHTTSTTNVASDQQATSLNPNAVHFNFNDIADKLSPSSPPQLIDDWSPSSTQISRACGLFFTNISHFIPFLHRATFDISQTPPHLLFSIMCVAYQYGDDPDCEDATGSGASLSIRCFHRARALLSIEEDGQDESMPHLTMVQAYFLLQICSMMYLCGKDSAYGLKMHSKMISHARIGGLLQPTPNDSGSAGDLESLWRDFIGMESLKRTVFAVHQIDALWYQILSVPRQLSHLEIRHDLPCPEKHWTASSAAEWAHQQLIARQSNSPIRYTDAVRRFLSSEADVASIPAFDPYGAINITQFLISSAREISGWSTMTGMLSLERFEPLRSSLVALGPYIRQQPDATPSSYAALCEATWQTAMIELQVWSPSHVGGIVEGSIDAILTQSTYLSPHVELLSETSIAKAVQPHVNWFLRYLDTTMTGEYEAPWVTLYAYKAFLIAWQLVRGGKPGSMEIVGIHDGDVEGAMRWARKVFLRRQRWQLGKLIMKCLDSIQN
ncbi:hypothetical protein PFICI_11570 [Pestalotiopsis fici W106-1]|uniref:C2H2-type domain-containing protein n=1 Tax=Pestalotiopsis fici (strain W106-1 / CGMCC3.15140) TaxID=1229662 RepID=W3WQR4_PESFW|nr:uncharacterized protein PFICI_11570 [Pestalotiopsis fici W106-1]ETS76183.1 hypothetical protein PFICI_11570 [Pestalotiopsis fici W106-1]